MQSFEHLDQHFNSLNTYSSPVAPHAFETIMMKRAKRKKPFIFWLNNYSVGIVGTICILGLSYFTFIKKETTSTESISTTIVSSTASSNSPQKNSSSNAEKIVALSSTAIATKSKEAKVINAKTEIIT
jgi:hypothetical protein